MCTCPSHTYTCIDSAAIFWTASCARRYLRSEALFDLQKMSALTQRQCSQPQQRSKSVPTTRTTVADDGEGADANLRLLQPVLRAIAETQTKWQEGMATARKNLRRYAWKLKLHTTTSWTHRSRTCIVDRIAVQKRKRVSCKWNTWVVLQVCKCFCKS